MNTDALKSIIEDAHKLAKADIAPDLVKPAVETIALRLERLVKDGFYVTPFPELTAPAVRTRIVVTPNGAAMKYDPLDDELPRLSASIEMAQDVGDEEPSQRATLYIGGKVLAHMKVYRGKHFAVCMVKQALKGAMSKLGRRRRNKANRRAREAAAIEAANV